MALPRSKYSDPIHTPGNEFTLDGKNYVGWYVITYQDKYIAGRTVDRFSKEIFPIVLETPSADTVKVFVEQKVTPTDDDKILGNWKRYFIQNKKSLHIIEVKKERYAAFKNTPGYAVGTLDWKLVGPAEDVVKGPYVYKGANNQNRVTTEKLETTIKGITNYIKDYSEFVE